MNQFIAPNLDNLWSFKKIRCKFSEIWEPKVANIYKDMYARGQPLVPGHLCKYWLMLMKSTRNRNFAWHRRSGPLACLIALFPAPPSPLAWIGYTFHRMKWFELREYKWNEYVIIAVNSNLSNCKKARRKGFRGFNGIRGLCVSAAVLYQPELWRPIHWRPANLLSWSPEIRWGPEILFFGLFRNCLNCDSLQWSHIHFIRVYFCNKCLWKMMPFFFCFLSL